MFKITLYVFSNTADFSPCALFLKQLYTLESHIFSLFMTRHHEHCKHAHMNIS